VAEPLFVSVTPLMLALELNSMELPPAPPTPAAPPVSMLASLSLPLLPPLPPLPAVAEPVLFSVTPLMPPSELEHFK
jgi:hypothetical protein